MSHRNDQTPCLECAKIFNRYRGFSETLKTWFTAIQIEHPEAHVSCAGRGKIDQEVAYRRGASRARWGQSAHNCNCALDLFELREGRAEWSPSWFHIVIAPSLYPALKWYGAKDAVFYELPHVELANWKELLNTKRVNLVE